MFKNIQKYLIINHPLLWNLKIVPVSFYLILLNIIFLVLGYMNGAINFTETDDDYSRDDIDGIIIFFSVLLSILGIIIWLVNYFKNNALKSFYPKNNFSLFKEWLIILLICFLNSTFIIAFYYGRDIRVRSYYSENEAKERCEILSQASFFIEGSYTNNSYDYEDGEAVETFVDTAAVITSTNDSTVKPKDYFFYRGKKYSNFSLLDKNINSYSFFDYDQDSLRKIKIKDWLVENKKEEIKQLFKKYLSIAKDHHLKANIDANQWLDLIYDYPKFEKYKNIGSKEFEVSYDYDNQNIRTKIDSTEQYYQTINKTVYLFNRYYVPEDALKHSYQTIAISWTKPTASFETLLISLLVSIGLSLLIFSFRISSGRNWLIALVGLGVLNIIFGIITAVASKSGILYLISIGILFIGLFIYFFLIIKNKKGKGISGITLNMMFWILPFFGPIVYAIVVKAAKDFSNYSYIGDPIVREKAYPFITFLKNNDYEFMWVNVVFIFAMMLLFTKKTKQWRGIAEN